jgi:hypothetical protein
MYLGENVDVRDLQVHHDTQCSHGARDELATVHHEVRVDEEDPTDSAKVFMAPNMHLKVESSEN